MACACLGAASASDTITYLDADGNAKTLTESCTFLTAEYFACNGYTLADGCWYAVSGGVEVSTRIECGGTVYVILLDGCRLDAQAGIEVSAPDAALTVYAGKLSSDNGKNGKIEGTGSLTAKGGEYDAGIGGGNGKAGRNITINGGNVTAAGEYGAGIGGGYGGSGSNITINGGTVAAASGDHNGDGIGRGSDGSTPSDIHVTDSNDYCTKHGGKAADEVIDPTDRETAFEHGTKRYFTMQPYMDEVYYLDARGGMDQH